MVKPQVLYVPESIPIIRGNSHIVSIEKQTPLLRPDSNTEICDFVEHALDASPELRAAIIPHLISPDQATTLQIQQAFDVAEKKYKAWLADFGSDKMGAYKAALNNVHATIELSGAVVVHDLMSIVREKRGPHFPIIVYTSTEALSTNSLQPGAKRTGPCLYVVRKQDATNHVQHLVNIFLHGPQTIYPKTADVFCVTPSKYTFEVDVRSFDPSLGVSERYQTEFAEHQDYKRFRARAMRRRADPLTAFAAFAK
jgi:hypothetical protein